MLRQEILDFIKWRLNPMNRLFVKNGSCTKIAKIFNETYGYNVSHKFVLYHKDKWILINNEPYEVDKAPLEIFLHPDFKKYALDHKIVIMDMDGLFDYTHINIEKESEAVNKKSDNDDKESENVNKSVIEDY